MGTTGVPAGAIRSGAWMGLEEGVCTSASGVSVDSLHHLGKLLQAFSQIKLPPPQQPTAQQQMAADHLGMFHWNLLKLPFGIDPQILKGLLDNGSFDVTFPQGFRVGTNTVIHGITFENGVLTDIDGETSDILGHLGYLLDGNTTRKLSSAEAFILGLPTRANLLSTTPLPNAEIHFASSGSQDLVVPRLDIPGLARVENMVIKGGTDIITTGHNSFDVETFSLKVPDSQVGRLTLLPDQFTNGENVITNSGARDLEVTFARGADGRYFLQHAQLTLVTGEASLASGDVTSGSAELTLRVDGTEAGVLTLHVDMPTPAANSVSAAVCAGPNVGAGVSVTDAGAYGVDAEVTVNTQGWSPDYSSWEAKYKIASGPDVERLSLFGDAVTLTDFYCDDSTIEGEWSHGLGAQSLTSVGCNGTVTLNLFGQSVAADLGDQALSFKLTPAPSSSGEKLYTAILDANVSDMKIGADEGELSLSGHLYGSVNLVDMGDGSVPDLRPVAGSIDLHHDGTTVLTSSLGTTRGTTTLAITDASPGVVQIRNTAKTSVPMLGDVDLNAGLYITGLAVENTSAGTPYYSTELGNYAFTSKVSGRAGAVSRIDSSTAGTLDLTQSGLAQMNVALGQSAFHVDAKTGAVDVKVSGGSVAGTLNYGDVTQSSVIKITPPESIHVVQRLSQGGEDLIVEMFLTPQGAIQANVNASRRTIDVSTAPNAGLSGKAIVRRKEAASGKYEVVGEIAVSSPYSVSGRVVGSEFVVNIEMPNTGITGIVTRDIVLKGGVLPKDTRFSLPIKGFKGEIALALATLSAKSRWTAADFGPATIDIPPQALAAAFPDLKEPVHVEITGLAHGQQYDLNFDPARGVEFAGVGGAAGGLKPVDLSVSVRGGDALNLGLTSSSALSGVRATFDLASGQLHVQLDGVALAAQVRDALINLSGTIIKLDQVDTEALVKSMVATVDTKSGTLKLDVIPYGGTDFTPAPQDLNAWLAWTQADWQHYSEQLANPAWKHLSAVSGIESLLPLLPPDLPRGRGTLYTDLAEPVSITLNLNELSDPPKFAAKMTEVGATLQKSLRFSWSIPNPPQESGVGEPLAYSDTHDAFFVIDPSDTKIPTLLGDALGLSAADAMALYKSGRVDMSAFINDPFLSQIFSAETITALAQHYLKGASGEDFSRGTHRFLLALSDLRSQHEAMTTPHAMAWSDSVRDVAVRTYPDPTYQGHAADAPEPKDGEGDGLNATYAVYIPGTTPEAYLALMSDVAGWKRWRPRFSGTRDHGDGVYSGRFLGRKFAITTESKLDAGLCSFTYRNVDDHGSQFLSFAGDTVIVPSKDGGIFVVDQVAVDAVGDDTRLYRGKYETLATADAKEKTFVDKIISLIASIKDPKKDPSVVHPVVQNRSYSNATRILSASEGEAPSTIALTSPSRAGLVTRPGIAAITADLKEFLFFEDPAAVATAEGEKPALADTGVKPAPTKAEAATGDASLANGPVLRLSVDDASRSHVTDLLLFAGFDAAQAATILQKGELSFEELAALPVIQDILGVDELTELARATLADNPYYKDELLLGHSDRFLYVIGDLARRYQGLTVEPRLLDARSFDGKYHTFSENNKRDYGDTVDSITYFVFPANVKYEDLVDAFAKPEEFHRYSSDYTPEACRATDQGDGTKVVDWKITLIGNCQIKVPTQLETRGGVTCAPWTAHGTQGFDENEGTWVLVKLKDGQVLALRYGLLNAATPGDASFAGTGLGAVAKLLSGIYEGKTGQGLKAEFGSLITDKA